MWRKRKDYDPTVILPITRDTYVKNNALRYCWWKALMANYDRFRFPAVRQQGENK